LDGQSFAHFTEQPRFAMENPELEVEQIRAVSFINVPLHDVSLDTPSQTTYYLRQ